MKNLKFYLSIGSIFLLLILQSCFDTGALTDKNGNSLALTFASGPANSDYNLFADGIVDGAAESLGFFMSKQTTAGSLENATLLVNEEAYMGLVQEDVLNYSRDTFITQYAADPTTAEKKYLKIASQLKIIMAAYEEDVFLLAKTSLANIAALAGQDVNMGPLDSETYITASRVLDSNSITCTRTNLAVTEAIEKMVNGDADCDATFLVGSSPNSVLQSISSTAGVHLIQVSMASGNTDYDQTGIINANDYGFQSDTIYQNMTVKTLVAAGPNFNNRTVDIFLDDIFDKAQEYEGFHSKWKNVSRALSFDYMRQNPHLAEYRAFCTIASAPEITSDDIEPNFYSGEAGSSYSDLATELIWLLSHNMDVDLKERDTTGSRENAIYLANGQGSMAIVQDDLFHFYEDHNLMLDSLKVASMKKIIPLHYEYLHLLGNTGGSGITSISQAQFTGKTINLGPKTSGTFITAINVIKSYGFVEGDNITYTFDSPGDAVSDVNAGTYAGMFVMSGLPYYRFYSHDTWNVATELLTSNLVAVSFNGSIPYPYDTDGAGEIVGDGDAVYENYPYPEEACSATPISTIRARAVLVASPGFDTSDIGTFMKSVFRKSYYMVNPPDPDLWEYRGAGGDYQPDQLWIPIRKTSIKTASDLDNYATDSPQPTLAQRGVYDTIIGAKEYFVNNPYGWCDEAVDFYLNMFPDN
ncbi:MAG: hypothetical protein GY754_15270 [bacterium]|nr:hypothetical protein [bacterium]